MCLVRTALTRSEVYLFVLGTPRETAFDDSVVCGKRDALLTSDTDARTPGIRNKIYERTRLPCPLLIHQTGTSSMVAFHKEVMPVCEAPLFMLVFLNLA
jgi:hypothetical protein